MARGISQRTSPSIRSFDDAPSVAFDQLKQHIARLPFGAVGFHFRRVTNDAAIANGANDLITWTDVVADREGFMPSGGLGDTITVPRELSGAYAVSVCVYFGSALSNVYVAIRHNATVVRQELATSQDRVNVSALVLLEDGDTLDVQVVNSSGGSITPTANTASATSPPAPDLAAWRISLL